MVDVAAAPQMIGDQESTSKSMLNNSESPKDSLAKLETNNPDDQFIPIVKEEPESEEEGDESEEEQEASSTQTLGNPPVPDMSQLPGWSAFPPYPFSWAGMWPGMAMAFPFPTSLPGATENAPAAPVVEPAPASAPGADVTLPAVAGGQPSSATNYFDPLLTETYSAPTVDSGAAVQPETAVAPSNPEDWVVMEEEGTKYWHNSRTGKSVWSKPPELMSAAEKNDPSAVWKEFRTTEGVPYYYSTLTGENSWTKPSGFKTDAEKAAERKILADMQKAAKAKQDEKKNTGMTKKKASAIFKGLLREKGVKSTMRWEEALAMVIKDGRYMVIKSLADRKECFSQYLKEQAVVEQKEQEEENRLVKQEYWELLQTTAAISWDTPYESVFPLISKDDRFVAFQEVCAEQCRARKRVKRLAEGNKDKDQEGEGEEEDDEDDGLGDTPESVYDMYVEKLFREDKKREKESRRAAKANLLALLDEAHDAVMPDMPWRAFVRLPGVSGDPRLYDMALPEEEKVAVYKAWVSKMGESGDNGRDLMLLREQQHVLELKQREAFRTLLEEKYMDGVFLDSEGKMRWRTFLPHIENDPRYIAVNTADFLHIPPKQIYRDYCTELALKIQKAKRVVTKVCRDLGVEIRPDMSAQELLAKVMTHPSLSDVGVDKLFLDPKHIYYAVLLLLVKAKPAEPEDEDNDGEDQEQGGGDEEAELVQDGADASKKREVSKSRSRSESTQKHQGNKTELKPGSKRYERMRAKQQRQQRKRMRRELRRKRREERRNRKVIELDSDDDIMEIQMYSPIRLSSASVSISRSRDRDVVELEVFDLANDSDVDMSDSDVEIDPKPKRPAVTIDTDEVQDIGPSTSISSTSTSVAPVSASSSSSSSSTSLFAASQPSTSPRRSASPDIHILDVKLGSGEGSRKRGRAPMRARPPKPRDANSEPGQVIEIELD